MRVISFDCGIENLAWCVYDVDNDNPISSGHIVGWKVDSIRQKSKRNILLCLVDYLRQQDFAQYIHGRDPTYILVEKQPARSGPVKQIENALFFYFLIDFQSICTSCKVLLFNPRNKFKIQSIRETKKSICKETRTYAQRKSFAVSTVSSMSLVKDTQWNDFLQNLKKKDDACDALIQAIAFTEEHRLYCQSNGTDDSESEVIRARKPVKLIPKAQSPPYEKGYTKANCKHLLKQILYPRARKERKIAMANIAQNAARDIPLMHGIRTHFDTLDSALAQTGLMKIVDSK